MLSVYTDGACGHDGRGGWAFAAICDNVIIGEQYGGEERTTNNRMELFAIIRAMQWLLQHGYEDVTIVTDSKYAKGSLQSEFSKLRKNADLIQTGRALYAVVAPRIEWVKGHAGDRWNEYVDKLCVAAKLRPESYYLR